jgi:hypothetical protein
MSCLGFYHEVRMPARRWRCCGSDRERGDPPTLGTVERAFKKIAHGTYVLTPYGRDTHGHFTHDYAAIWKPYLVEFMSGLPPAPQAVR